MAICHAQLPSSHLTYARPFKDYWDSKVKYPVKRKMMDNIHLCSLGFHQGLLSMASEQASFGFCFYFPPALRKASWAASSWDREHRPAARTEHITNTTRGNGKSPAASTHPQLYRIQTARPSLPSARQQLPRNQNKPKLTESSTYKTI